MSAIMLCTCSGDQSRFEDLPRSPESLATRDFSANGSSSKIASRETTPDDSQVNEVESDLRETLSLNYEEARALLGRLEHQRGNFDAALQVLQGIDIRSLRQRMTSAIAESIKPRGPPRSSRRKTSQVNGMLMHMSMHSVSLLLEAILLKAKSLEALGRVTEAAEECRTIIDIIESAWPYGVPDGTTEECKLIDIFHSALEYLPKLWMRSGCFEEAIIAYRRALETPWNLDSQRSANLQKDLAVTLLYCGVEVKFPQEFGQKGNLVTPGNNIEEAILLLLILTRKLSLQEIKWDPDLVNHLMYALSLSGHFEVLSIHLEMLLPGTYTRSKRWYILALCYSAAGMDDSALNIIRNGFCVLERKGKPHIPSLLLGAKLCCKNPKHASEGIKFANKAMKSFGSHDMHFISVVNHFLGVCYGPFSRSSTSHLDKLRLQDDALRLLQDAATMANYNPEIMYSLAWENAMQRKLNAAVESATECLEMVMGGSVSAWKLLILVLSAQQNLQEAEAVADIAIDEAEKDDQLDILRLKAQIQASRGQFKSAVESFRVLLATIQAKKEVWKSTNCDKIKSVQKLEIDVWLDLASMYTKLEAWRDSNICLDKAISTDFFYPKCWHVRGILLEAQSLHQEALMAFSFALSINPDYVPSMVSMAGILRDLGGNSISIARTFLRNALRLEPTNHRAWLDLGLVLKSEGSLLEAADCFQAAYELRELSPIQDFSEQLPIMLH
ncbi:protein NPGR1-like isoform X1 [Phragmites australis]|uniref:protein NPGR1-like isoform X1 n=1 Tax=Phragmites australis TaxID=29695 RepID=UPI002D76CAC3|nr:protein NPGR1-like isoform X1 [Phragmites australis]XP_062216454.1 protein NPGR1-like isoform X1 [Phragmites australis]XP_062216455.1 protein NPGR1-like isoform X1 [Phragmites australis]